MFEVDGSQKSGSGTLLRLAVAVAAIKGEPLHITNIRASRPQPGLKAQHLESVLTAAKLCGAEVKGATLGSRELMFTPGKIVGGQVEASIETAGSIPMLFLSALPVCLYAQKPVRLHVARGGTDTRNAPTINYLRQVLLPTLAKMGVKASIKVQRYGYYPKGMGEATLSAEPNQHLNPINLTEAGMPSHVEGVSVCTFLADRQVAERQTKAATATLSQAGFKAQIETVNDQSNPIQKGSSIALWAHTATGYILGADGIGELRKMAEDVGNEAAQHLLAEIRSGAAVDEFLSDMLIPYMALAKGKSAILTRCQSEHVEANVWLMEKMLDCHFRVEKVNNLVCIEKS